MKKGLLIALAVFGSSILYVACEKDKVTPAFAGEWENIDDDTKITLKLTGSTIIFSLYFGTDGIWLQAGGFDGNITYTDEIITVTPTRVSLVLDGEVIYFEQGDPEFENFLAEIGFDGDNNLTINYSVEGNELTIEFDAEVEIFTKVE